MLSRVKVKGLGNPRKRKNNNKGIARGGRITGEDDVEVGKQLCRASGQVYHRVEAISSARK